MGFRGVTALCAALLLVSACSRSDEPLGSAGGRTAELAQDSVPTDSCRVEIRGERRVCLDCEGGQRVTVLTAVPDRAGGTFTWTPAVHPLVTLTPRGAQLDVKGVQPSTAIGDVSVAVEYRVGTAVCSSSAALTVVKPTSLRLLDEWVFKVENGQVVSATRNGQPQPQIPGSVNADLRPVLEQELGGKKVNQVRGVIVIRYYEVLDQFQQRWLCNGNLTEVITPKTKATGGTAVVQGLPQSPDRLFNLDEKKKFKPLDILQLLRVSGCEVRRNRFVLGEAAATSQQLTPQQYQNALDERNGAGKPKPKPKS